MFPENDPDTHFAPRPAVSLEQELRTLCLRLNAPVISTDIQNSVLIGNFKNSGAARRRQADDVPGDAQCRVYKKRSKCRIAKRYN